MFFAAQISTLGISRMRKDFIMAVSNQKKGLSIIIVGAGKVGETLTSQLVKEGHDITIIDKLGSAVNRITGLYDIMGVIGNGASYQTQMDAGIESADLLIAVTDSDELNMLCCIAAKQVAGVSAIARVRNPEYNSEAGYYRDKLGLAMIINPELETAREASRILYLPTALEVGSFAHGQAELVKFKVPEGSKIDNMSIMQLGKGLKNRILICAVERSDSVYIPDGNFVLKAGDILSFVCRQRRVRHFFEEIGVKTRQVRSAMIVGGGKCCYYLANMLIAANIDVKIIEQNRARCEELADLLPDAIIINGDGTNEDLLREEGIETVESFVPLTGIDEVNIILTLFARRVSNAKVITKVSHMDFSGVLDSLELGSVLFPKFITSEAIIAYVRAKANSSSNNNIETLYHMYDHRVEAMEFRVDKKSAATGVCLKDLSLKDNLLISFINRNGNIVLPGGMDEIKPGDTVMVVTTHTGLSEIDDILKQ